MTYLSLNRQEYDRLERFTIQTNDARLLRRAQALLWIADGELIEIIAARLRVSVQTIYNWLKRYKERSELFLEERLSDGPRSGRPPTALGIIDPIVQDAFEQDPRDLGYTSTIWTAPLLTRYLQEHHQIEISPWSVRLAISRLGLRWKRPRHTLALRPATWRQSKGGSNAG